MRVTLKMKPQFNHTLGKCQVVFDRESHLPKTPILFDIPRDLKYLEFKWNK